MNNKFKVVFFSETYSHFLFTVTFEFLFKILLILNVANHGRNHKEQYQKSAVFCCQL